MLDELSSIRNSIRTRTQHACDWPRVRSTRVLVANCFVLTPVAFVYPASRPFGSRRQCVARVGYSTRTVRSCFERRACRVWRQNLLCVELPAVALKLCLPQETTANADTQLDIHIYKVSSTIMLSMLSMQN